MSISRTLNTITNELNFRLREKVNQTRIVMFLLPTEDQISGGIISVISIYKELKNLESDLGINVFLSTHPQAPPFMGYTLHNRDVKIYDFKQLIKKFLSNSSILFHVPESHVIQFCKGLRHPILDKLKEDKNLTYDLNILNQNPYYFPVKKDLIPLLARIRNLTQTTAHYAYNKPFELGKKTFPSSYLGTPPGTDNFEIIPFENKRNTLLVSHDDHPQKEVILVFLKNAIPDLEIIVVKNMTFEKYTEHQKYCKFGLTFGEGMDAYFIRCILYGGIGFAVSNDVFFTDDIKALPTVFNSYEQLGSTISPMIRQLNSPEPFTALAKTTRSVLGKYYNNTRYKKRIEHIHTNWLNNKGCIATEGI
jgi:hypothetical protein